MCSIKINNYDRIEKKLSVNFLLAQVIILLFGVVKNIVPNASPQHRYAQIFIFASSFPSQILLYQAEADWKIQDDWDRIV